MCRFRHENCAHTTPHNPILIKLVTYLQLDNLFILVHVRNSRRPVTWDYPTCTVLVVFSRIKNLKNKNQKIHKFLKYTVCDNSHVELMKFARQVKGQYFIFWRIKTSVVFSNWLKLNPWPMGCHWIPEVYPYAITNDSISQSHTQLLMS